MESEAPPTLSHDLLSLQLDKIAPSNLKSIEEKQRHSIDRSLEEDPIEKAILFLSTGDEVQKLSVTQSLADLYRQDPTGCSQKLIAKMQQCLPIASSEFHLATSVTIRSLMERKVIPIETLIQTFLQSILSGTEHRDQAVADAWVDCLVDIIPYLPQSVLQKDVLQVVASKSAHQKPITSRIACCRIIGALCWKYPSLEAKRDLLPVVLSLCQDVHLEVRGAAALQIPSVVRLLGGETSKNLLLPALVDLASDEIPRVKEAAFTALVESIPFFSSDVIKTVVLPLLSQLVTYAFKYDSNMELAIASSYGKMVTGLERVIQSSEKESYLKTYFSLYERCSSSKLGKGHKNPTKLGQSSGQGSSVTPLVGESAIRGRQYCAYNFPAMAKFVYSESENSRSSLEDLHRIFHEFISDPSPVVRKAITVSFHEVVSIYGKYKSLLKPDICKALRDTDETVLGSFINHLGFILVNFKGLNQNQSEKNFDSEVLSALLACDGNLESTRNWRLHVSFIEQMEVLWYLFPAESVYNNFVSNFFKKLYTHRALPIRMALIRTILITLKYNPKEMYRMDIINALNDLAVSQNFYNRMLYIRTCNIALDIFSTFFFKQFFLPKLLKMTVDPIANIRWATCKLFPKLYYMAKLHSDRETLDDIESRMATLSCDRDSEVLLMIQKVRSEIHDEEITDLFPEDQLRYDEEKKVFTLNQKLVQNFPASCAKMFEPSIGGTRIIRRTSYGEINESRSDAADQFGSSSDLFVVNKTPGASGSSRAGKTPGSKGNFNSEQQQPDFTDKEFLVDAGISLPLNTIRKITPPKNNNYSNGSEENDKISISANDGSQNQTIAVDGNKNNQSECKTSPKKKPIFRHSIPVRKKVTPVEQCLIKKSDEVKTSTDQVLEVEKRQNNLRNHKQNNSLGALKVDKRHSLELLDTEKRHSLEVVDINKNLTERSDSDVNCANGTVQRRKKSQLPRPLSCVVLPIRNKVVEKPNSNSKLPVMRRT